MYVQCTLVENKRVSVRTRRRKKNITVVLFSQLIKLNESALHRWISLIQIKVCLIMYQIICKAAFYPNFVIIYKPVFFRSIRNLWFPCSAHQCGGFLNSEENSCAFSCKFMAKSCLLSYTSWNWGDNHYGQQELSKASLLLVSPMWVMACNSDVYLSWNWSLLGHITPSYFSYITLVDTTGKMIIRSQQSFKTVMVSYIQAD